MEKIAFVMTLLPGYEAEYKKRHDEIWPDLVTALKQAGVHDYSIYFDEESHKLFAVLKRSPSNTIDDLPLHPVVQKWWKYMADIMETHDDNEPISTPLKELFHLD